MGFIAVSLVMRQICSPSLLAARVPADGPGRRAVADAGHLHRHGVRVRLRRPPALYRPLQSQEEEELRAPHVWAVDFVHSCTWADNTYIRIKLYFLIASQR